MAHILNFSCVDHGIYKALFLFLDHAAAIEKSGSITYGCYFIKLLCLLHGSIVWLPPKKNICLIYKFPKMYGH